MTTNDVFCFVLGRIDLFQWATLLFQPFWPDIWPNRVQNGQKRPFWAISGSGGPPKAPLTRETVPLNRPGCALTCYTYIPHCSACPEPQHPLMAPKLQFWAIWGPFGAPIGPPDQRKGSIALPRVCPVKVRDVYCSNIT